MDISEITVNPDNLSDWQIPTGSVRMGCITVSNIMLNRKSFNECLSAHMTLNTYLDDQLGDNDWGGQYANWLNSMGFTHQCDEGWWSLTAVTPENITLFIQSVQDEAVADRISSALERFNRKRFHHDFTLVEDFLTVFS